MNPDSRSTECKSLATELADEGTQTFTRVRKQFPRICPDQRELGIRVDLM